MSATVIFANTQDVDCSVAHYIWDGLEDLKVVDVTRDGDATIHDALEAMSKEEDILIFFGHGCPYGLFNPNVKDESYYLFSRSHIRFVKAKRVICMWCYASSFGDDTKFPAFYTSMFISNAGEARCCNIPATQEQVTESEVRFCKDLNHLLVSNTPMKEWKNYMMGRKRNDNPIDVFNYNGTRYIP